MPFCLSAASQLTSISLTRCGFHGSLDHTISGQAEIYTTHGLGLPPTPILCLPPQGSLGPNGWDGPVPFRSLRALGAPVFLQAPAQSPNNILWLLYRHGDLLSPCLGRVPERCARIALPPLPHLHFQWVESYYLIVFSPSSLVSQRHQALDPLPT